MDRLSLILIWLLQKLYPPARAWRMPPPKQTGEYITDEDGNVVTDEAGSPLVTEDYTVSGGWFYRLHRALSIQFGIAYTIALGTQDFQLPDNPNFTITDAHEWYARLGIFDSGLVSFDDMKLAIKAWWNNFNATITNKQHYTYVQDQLRAAGFDIGVFENRFFPGPVARTPGGAFGTSYPVAMCGYPTCGQVQCGQTSGGRVGKIINYVEASKDNLAILTNLRSVFFIADPAGLTTPAVIPAAREVEFRQLVIKIKPQHTIAVIHIEFI